MSFQPACTTDAVNEGDVTAVRLTDDAGNVRRIAIARDENGGWHAIDELCTHGEVSLAEGDIDDCSIECWAHGATFDLVTGEATLPATSPVHVYPVDVRGDNVYVNID